MNKEEFLNSSDQNLVDYYVTNTVDEKGEESLGVMLIVKFGDFDEQEVYLDKKDLETLLSDVKYAEENGLDYINE